MLVRMCRQGNPHVLLVEMQISAATVESNYLKKLKMELHFGPAIPFLGIYPKKPETLMLKDICTPVFIAALFTIAKIGKQSKCSLVDEWIEKLWYIYTMEYYLSVKRRKSYLLQQHG